MAASTQSTAYLNDKQKFFSAISKESTKLIFVKTAANNQGYASVARNLPYLEQDFADLFDSLKEHGENREKFWLYSYYCSLLLRDYYKAYGKDALADKYQSISEEIDAHFQAPSQNIIDAVSAPNESVMERIKKQLSADLSALVSTPLHSSKIKNMAGLTNITRMQIVFGRIIVQTSLVAVNEAVWFGKLTGNRAKVDGLLKMLDKPSNFFNVLSVGVFAVRFAMNLGTLLKHTFWPNKAESTLSLAERFSHDLYKRHCEMLNDFVWGSVNLLTNYRQIFNISAPVANWTMAAFLIFDISLLIYRRWLAEKEYLVKKEQYKQEIMLYKNDPEHVKVLQEQLEKLHDRWQVTDATYWFNITAAVLLMSGFSAALMISTAAFTPVCFFVCAFAIAMYVSGDVYGAYKEKSLILEKKESRGEDTVKAMQEVKTAQTNLAVALLKNTIIPIILMGTFAVSWPAAILLTVAYLGYEIGNGYLKSSRNSQEEPEPKVVEYSAYNATQPVGYEPEDNAMQLAAG